MIALGPEQTAWLKTLATDLYLPQGYFLTPARMALTPDGKKDPRPLFPYTGWRSVTQTLETVEAWFSDLSLPFNGFLARSADMLVLDTDSPEFAGGDVDVDKFLSACVWVADVIVPSVQRNECSPGTSRGQDAWRQRKSEKWTDSAMSASPAGRFGKDASNGRTRRRA